MDTNKIVRTKKIFNVFFREKPAMMLVMLKIFGTSHPPVMNDYEPLPRSRYVVAILALLIFVLCFMPVPLEPYDLGGRP